MKIPYLPEPIQNDRRNLAKTYQSKVIISQTIKVRKIPPPRDKQVVALLNNLISPKLSIYRLRAGGLHLFTSPDPDWVAQYVPIPLGSINFILKTVIYRK